MIYQVIQQLNFFIVNVIIFITPEEGAIKVGLRLCCLFELFDPEHSEKFVRGLNFNNITFCQNLLFYSFFIKIFIPSFRIEIYPASTLNKY